MSRVFNLCVMLIGASLVLGCSQKSGLVAADAVTTLSARPAVAAVAENSPVTGNKLVKKAKSAIGTPYVLGGSAPGGFDCSGLVKWAYNSIGVSLPRTAREQSVVGKKIKNVKEMRPGDIVAFRHPKRGYHTGIYVGDGKFVHSPSKRKTVKINSLSDPYFKDILLGARRVKLDGSENLIAQSEERLRALVAEKSSLTLSKRNIEKIRNASRSKRVQTAKKAGNAKSVALKSRKSSGRDVSVHNRISGKKAASSQNGKSASPKKSTIASQASKIKSLKEVTGKKSASRNGDAHAKLATASKKASSQKSVSMLTPKAQKMASKGRKHS